MAYLAGSCAMTWIDYLKLALETVFFGAVVYGLTVLWLLADPGPLGR